MPQSPSSPKIQSLRSASSPIPAQGRISDGQPVAVLDIGSNSVRLVVYERLCRSLTPLYNEKALCGLGKGVGQTGALNDTSVALALRAVGRYAALARQMSVQDL